MSIVTNLIRTYLIVDDDDFVRKSIERSLNSFGDCTIHHANDGLEAIETLANADTSIDVIISDFSMPRMDGLELLKNIRTDKAPIDRDIPFVMLTGKTERQLAGLALSLDVDAFLTKPVKRKALELLLNRIAGSGLSRPVMQPVSAYQKVSLEASSQNR